MTTAKAKLTTFAILALVALTATIVVTPTTAQTGAWQARASLATARAVAMGAYVGGMFDVAGGNRDAGATGTLKALASTPPVNGRIAFYTGRDGNEEIYVMNGDGSGQTNVSARAGNDRYPDWSPDGTKLAFQSDRDGAWEIYVMNGDGSGQTRLTSEPALDEAPAWSPDGSKIAFQSDRDGNVEIYVMNADGSGQTRLTTNAVGDIHPVWSPDGAKIAFYSVRDGNNEIYVMNADGSGQTRLTADPANDANPAWSPDSTKLAFASNRGGDWEIYVMNADGTGVTLLAAGPADDVQPDWSPDGTKLVFVSGRDGDEEIYVMNADGSGQTRLTTSPGLDAAPDWAVLTSPPPPPPAAPNVVVNTNDSGPGSLRAALAYANANPGSDTVVFNILTTDPGFNGQWFRIAPLFPLPDLFAGGTTIAGGTQTAFTGNTNRAGPEIFLDGRSHVGGAGLSILSSSNVIEGLTVSGFPFQGIRIDGGNGNVVRGNYVGTDPTGTLAIPNGRTSPLDGVTLFAGATNTVIGGTAPDARNVVSGNTRFGVSLAGGATGTVIQGNYIGTNATGTAAIGNSEDGVFIGAFTGAASSNTVGGTAAGAGNVISGNGRAGVGLGDVSAIVVEGNLIGTDASGTAAIPNAEAGVKLFQNVTGSRIGDAPGLEAGNVISGNGNAGIFVGAGSSGNLVRANFIGTTRDGSPLGNAANGVHLEAGPNSIVANTIAHNAFVGVLVASGGDNRIHANRIHDNGGLGIDLGGDGVTQNDLGDADEGPNHLQNFPVVTSARPNAAGSVRIRATFSGAPNAMYRFNWYANSSEDPSGFGEGERMLGWSDLTTDGSGNLAIDTAEQLTEPVTLGEWITATATSPPTSSPFVASTSEFSAAVQVIDAFVVTNTNDSGPGSLRAAIDGSNANPGPDRIVFAIPAIDPDFNGQWFTIKPLSPFPPLGDDGTTIDGVTQTAFTGDTNPAGPEIFLDGNGQAEGQAFSVQSSSNVIEGLAIGNFPFQAILIQKLPAVLSGNVVRGNYIGVDPTGTAPRPNGARPGPHGPLPGISVVGAADTVIGGKGAGDRNLISGNQRSGVDIQGPTTGTLVQGNYIGTNAAGTGALGNGSVGIEIGTFMGTPANVTIGGTTPGAGNVISGNARSGVETFEHPDNPTPIDGLTLQGNLIGTDAAGANALPNGQEGVRISNVDGALVGGSGEGARNVISGNSRNGIQIDANASGVVVRGNYIGTDGGGGADLGNGSAGIAISRISGTIVGGTSPEARNVISGNGRYGVLVLVGADDTLIQGNFIGTNAAGAAAVPNGSGGGGDAGLHIQSNGNTIGGTQAGAGNLISGNNAPGIGIFTASATGNVIQRNYIGTDAAGTTAIPNGSGSNSPAVSFGGTNNLIGGTSPGARNVISGNTGPGIAANGSGNRIQGNYIGTDASGTTALGNGAGITVFGADITVGGRTPGTGNVVSGNGAGIAIFTIGAPFIATRISVEGNFVGTDATGTAAIPNRGDGVSFFGNVTDSRIGGPVAGARNVISGNQGFGIGGGGGSGNRIEGNYIGTNAAGTSAVANGRGGVNLSEVSSSYVITRNLISGNNGAGVGVGNVSDVAITGNLIGTNAAGTASVGNSGNGILVNTPGATIGGTAPGERNVVSGNLQRGVLLTVNGSGAVVAGNLIGTDAAGTAPLPNGLSGVILLGNGARVEANVVANNGQLGVGVALTATGNTITRNSIFGNGLLGIDLVGGSPGVTTNDPGDVDTGPNGLQNFPVLVIARLTPLGLRVTGHIDTPDPNTVTIEIFANSVSSPGGDPSGYGEGAEFLGTVTPSTDGGFTVLLRSVPAGTLITATATDAAGNTSEFAANIPARAPGPP